MKVALGPNPDVYHVARISNILLKYLIMKNMMNFTCLIQNTEYTMWRGEIEHLNAQHIWNIYHTSPENQPITSQQREKRNVLSQNELELQAIMFNYMLWNCAYYAVLPKKKTQKKTQSIFCNSVDFCVVGLFRGLHFIPYFQE